MLADDLDYSVPIRQATLPRADEVNRNWETLESAEKGRASVLDGVPPALPALALADKVVGRAGSV